MDIILTKQLKDAGFKFRKDPIWILTPTLSELIEACGDGFYSIYKRLDEVEKTWIAETLEDYPTGWKQTYGATPEEAVAKLWLELNSIKPEGAEK